MTLRQAVSAEIARHGQTYTLRSAVVGAGANAWTSGTEVASYSTCKGRERRYKPVEIRGGIAEHDTLLTLDASTCLAVPKNGDKIAAGEFTGDAGADWLRIVNVYAPRVAGVAAVYKLQVRK